MLDRFWETSASRDSTGSPQETEIIWHHGKVTTGMATPFDGPLCCRHRSSAARE